MTVDDVSVSIRADVAQLVSGLKEAGGATRAATQEMQASFDGVRTGAREAGGGVDAFTERLRDMRSEMRMGNFITTQIASMGIASKSAAGEVAQLAAAFMLGGPLGAGIEVVKILVTSWNESGEAVRKANELAETSTKRLREQTDLLIMSIRGVSEAEKLRHSEIGPLLRQEADLKQNVIKFQIQYAEATAALKAAMDNEEKGKAQQALTRQAAAASELRDAKAMLAITQEQREAATKAIGGVDDAQKSKNAQQAAIDRQKVEEQHNVNMLELTAQLLSGQEKLQAEFYAKAAQLRARDKTSIEQNEQEIALLRQKMLQDVAELRDEATAKQIESEQKRLDTIGKLEIEAAKKIAALNADNDRAALERSQRLTEFTEKQTEEMVKMAESIGKAFGTMFAGMVDGTMTGASAFKMMTKAIIESAVKAVQSYAASDAAAAYFSQAGIPVIGPILGAGAAAAAGALILGLVNNIPSAAGGFDIPSGVNPIVQAHSSEMVLPAPIADGFRSIIAAGGGGGGMTVHVHAMDAVSFKDWLRTPGAQLAMADWHANASRDGRIP